MPEPTEFPAAKRPQPSPDAEGGALLLAPGAKDPLRKLAVLEQQLDDVLGRRAQRARQRLKTGHSTLAS